MPRQIEPSTHVGIKTNNKFHRYSIGCHILFEFCLRCRKYVLMRMYYSGKSCHQFLRLPRGSNAFSMMRYGDSECIDRIPTESGKKAKQKCPLEYHHFKRKSHTRTTTRSLWRKKRIFSPIVFNILCLLCLLRTRCFFATLALSLSLPYILLIGNYKKGKRRSTPLLFPGHCDVV